MPLHSNRIAIALSPQQMHTDKVLKEPKLVAPVNNAKICTMVGAPTVLYWNGVADADFYIVQLCRNSSFTGPTLRAKKVAGGTGLQQLTVNAGVNLFQKVEYYWRVVPYNTTGGAGPKSEAWHFEFHCDNLGDRRDEEGSDVSCDSLGVQIQMEAKYKEPIQCGKKNRIRALPRVSRANGVSVGAPTWTVVKGNGQIKPWPGAAQPNFDKEYRAAPDDDGTIEIQICIPFAANGQTVTCCNKVRFEVDCEQDEFWAKINGGSLISGHHNRWSYGWVEQIVNKLGEFIDKPAGRSSASTGFKAYNSVEANNAQNGVQGNSINVAELPPESSILPVSGSPVLRVRIEANCDMVNEVYFSYENAVKPVCEPATP